MSASATTPAALRSRWLFGSATDWMLGCGGVYAIVLMLQIGMGSDLQRWVPGGLMVLLFSLPHYGATLLRAYERSEDRQRYWLFVAPITAVLAALFVAGLHWGLLGSLLLTLYLTWSPWHYSGQNYGVFLMLAGRRGVPASGLAKRLLWWSFVLSYALTILGMHGAQGGNYTPLTYEGTAFAMIPLGFSGDWVDVAIGAVGLAYVASLGGAIFLMLRGAPARRGALAALAPSLGVAALQASWFAVPVLARGLGTSAQQSMMAGIYSGYGFLWIATVHSIQYLWVTLYYAVGSEAAAVQTRFLGKAALAGFAIWTVPGLIFAPGLLGDLPYESGLAVLVAAMVNLHHFILDGALWKLRDGRVAKVLLGATHEGPVEERTRPWFRPIVWVTGTVCVVLSAVSFWESEFGFGRALERADLQRARTAVERIAWLGRDGPARHTKLGRLLAERGQIDEARASYERSLELRPTSLAWQSLGMLEESQQRWSEAAEAYASALELTADDVGALYRFGNAAMEAGQPERARDALERAVELAPANSQLRPALAKARRLVRAQQGEGAGDPADPAGRGGPAGAGSEGRSGGG